MAVVEQIRPYTIAEVEAEARTYAVENGVPVSEAVDAMFQDGIEIVTFDLYQLARVGLITRLNREKAEANRQPTTKLHSRAEWLRVGRFQVTPTATELHEMVVKGLNRREIGAENRLKQLREFTVADWEFKRLESSAKKVGHARKEKMCAKARDLLTEHNAKTAKDLPEAAFGELEALADRVWK
jgi:hypothetical protein